MTGRDPEKMLRAEARRYPVVAELLDRLVELTDDEIAAAPLPMAWYRATLMQMRNKERYRNEVNVMRENMDEGSPFFRHGKNPSIKGKQAVYRGPDCWVKMFQSEMQLRSGTSVFFPFTGGMWVDCSFGPKVDLRQIAPYCPNPSDMSLDDYKAAFNQQMLGQHPDAPLLFDPQQSSGATQHLGPSPALAALGVRFT